eukprot:Amastigsp_a514554_17.p2 type:complete len:175 gc:universal Amastigsp_a514554_17:310-834(+)
MQAVVRCAAEHLAVSVRVFSRKCFVGSAHRVRRRGDVHPACCGRVLHRVSGSTWRALSLERRARNRSFGPAHPRLPVFLARRGAFGEVFGRLTTVLAQCGQRRQHCACLRRRAVDRADGRRHSSRLVVDALPQVAVRRRRRAPIVVRRGGQPMESHGPVPRAPAPRRLRAARRV